MAATTDSFRSSLHGFNRMDVVQFIQKTTSEHELELRRLAEERTRQQEGCTTSHKQYHAGGGIGQRADLAAIGAHYQPLGALMTLTSSAVILS